jgi:hypothetical protein
MLVVLFSLLLLSVIGLGMMYSTNMETSINYNYRDKQIAYYAALAGLQEARDRIQPATFTIVAPLQLPTTSAQNVVYIVADSTISPWDSTITPNVYLDTELCQEQVMSLARTIGVPCTTTPTGSGWYRKVVDDSTSWPWNTPNTDLKWVRITLKGNNMTPVAVNPADTMNDEVCWNGATQMSTPSTYTTGCRPIGGVTSVTLITSGSYTASTPVPTVNLIGGGGSGAVATAVMASTTSLVGVVTAINLTTGGAGYSVAPTVVLSGGGGVGATATAALGTSTVTNGFVTAVSITTGGSGYTTAPAVTISGGGGTGATAVATIATSTTVTSLTLDSAGSQCYAAPPPVAIGGAGGSGTAAHATLEATKSCVFSWTAPASPQCTNKLDAAHGYNPVDQKAGLTLNQGNGSFSGTLYVRTADEKSPNGFTIENPGYDPAGYASSFTSNLQLAGSVTWADCGNVSVTVTTGYRLQSITLDSPGSGFTGTPTVTIGSGSGTAVAGPTAHAGVGNLGVIGVALTNGGSGYTSQPTVIFSGGGGSGAAATATIQTTSTSTSYVASVTLGPGGSGYTSAPTVTFVGGGGSGAVAVATVTTSTVTNYYVDHIDVNPQGTGYTSDPTVTITGGAVTTPATAWAQISGGVKFGQVWLLTSYAQTKSGARSMLQMEVASPVLGIGWGGALTLDGPNPVIDAMPNSSNFTVKGADKNTCSETADPDHPAIDGYDDPNASPPTNSVSTIINSLPRPLNYTGSGGTPSVQNGYGTLGETVTSPSEFKDFIDYYKGVAISRGTYYNSSTVGSFNPTYTTKPSITFVDGNLTLNGNGTGYGILIVTGTLTMSGNFSWYGLVLVVGDGNIQMNGGGNGAIVGMVVDAKIWDASHNPLPTLGQPTFDWNGGGVNSVQFDHCWSTDLLAAVPYTPPPSPYPLKILSLRALPY